ncbi:tyrosine-type DNA invertase [Escherichia coli]|uniref:tyrosine-type DNA invertase n=1 Tax=Escherichia coli TaxID=562 RepID=UPI003984D80A
MKNKADNKKRNFLTHSEIESLLKAANTGPHAARNYCLTLLCFIHGFRASEICRLRISDIDLKAKCIYIHRLKKGFSTTHPLLNKEIQALKNWLSIRTSYPHAESEWVFLSRKGNPLSRQQFYHIISTSGGNAGLSLEIHPHMLRHSCGFALANMGIDTRLKPSSITAIRRAIRQTNYLKHHPENTNIYKPFQIDFRGDHLQAKNQETYFMMRIMIILMAGKHLFSPRSLS